MTAPTTTILLPAFNEAESLPVVLNSIREYLSLIPGEVELLVVDDGSTDATADIAIRCGARLIRHPHRKGAGAAVKTGILHARGERVLLMDADATYPAVSIPTLLLELEFSRQVIGTRTRESGTIRWLRIPAKFLLRKLGEFLVRHPVPDLNSGMRAFGKRDALAFLHLLPDGHSCMSTLTLCFLGMGLPVRFVPIDYLPRIGKSKFHPVRDTFRFGVQILRSVSYFAPLRIFLSASIVLFLAGCGKSAWDVARKGGLEESDIILFTFSLGAGMMGLLSDLIVKVANKPLFEMLHFPPPLPRAPEDRSK